MSVIQKQTIASLICKRTTCLSACLVIAAACLLFNAPTASAQGGTLLLVSQPNEKTDKSNYLDLVPHIEPALRETNKFDILVYRPDLPAVRAAVADKTLTEKDTALPLSKEMRHKIGLLTGARYIFTVSAQTSKEGILSDGELESLIGTSQWSTILADHITPAKLSGNRKIGLLESVHLLVSGYSDHIVRAAGNMGPVNVGPTAPFPNEPKTNNPDTSVKPDKTVKNTGRNAATTKTPNGANANPVGSNPLPSGGNPGNTVGGGGSKTAAATPGNPAVSQGATANTVSAYDLVIDRARRNGDIANLIVQLRRAVTEKPRDARLRHDLIQAYNERGWRDQAREEASRALLITPKDSSLHRFLGEAMMEEGEINEALKQLQEAVRLDDKDPANYVALGDAYWTAAKYDECVKTYGTAAQIDPKSPIPHRRLARYYVQKGLYTECLAALNEAKKRTAPSDLGTFTADHTALLASIEAVLQEGLARTKAARNNFVNGTRNREETFKELSDVRKRADEAAAFLDGLPDVGFNRVQALYSQAASMVVQTAEKLQDYLETQNMAQDEEASLLRIEAGKQLGDAGRALKAMAAKSR